MSQRVEIRIVAGDLKGRRVACRVTPDLRPTPLMVRQALFSILGNAVPDRPFIDVFAGTGVFGLEAISRGASQAVFIERDFKLAQQIDDNLTAFQMQERGRVLRADAYRWVERWQPPADVPVNIFVSPPFPDLARKVEEFARLVQALRDRAPAGSVITLQLELGYPPDALPMPDWECRTYGRNVLCIWVKPILPLAPDAVA